MESGKISVRYARAIYEYALDKKSETLLYKVMHSLIKCFSKYPIYRKIIHDPTVSSEKKRNLFLFYCNENPNLLISILDMIIKNGRVNYIERIALMYEKEYRKNKGIVVIHFITAKVATEDIKKTVVQFLNKKIDGQMEFYYQVNPELIGGFILRIEDKLLDGSVKRQLNQVKCQI